MDAHHVVIIGGGFGGLYAAQSFGKNPNVQVTLIDRRNFHLFQPLLYQVATGGLSPGDIASPLRAVMKRQKNIRVIMGEVIDFDVNNRKVILRDDEIAYDTLIVSAGVKHSYFGNDQWELSAPGLKTVEDSMEMRRRIFLAFEAAEREEDPELQQAWKTFVIVGGGPTGVELAGALGELAQQTLKDDFRAFDVSETEIVLIEGAERILPTYHPSLSRKAEESLRKLGVTIRTGCMVTDLNSESVTLGCGEHSTKIKTRTALWAAGVQASPLGRLLADQTGAPTDRIGRVIVEPDLSLPKHPNIFVIGDLANFSHQNGAPLPGVAPAAMQQGAYVAKLIRARHKGKPIKPFRYIDRGGMAVIGRNAAVADLRGLRFSGFFAWFLWLFVHIMYLVEFDNRLLVATQWAWSYFTRNRGARLITNHEYVAIKRRKNGVDSKAA